MTMPLDLVFVRHGESEGNYAYSMSYRGDDRYFQPGTSFLQRHGSKWLTLTTNSGTVWEGGKHGRDEGDSSDATQGVQLCSYFGS